MGGWRRWIGTAITGTLIGCAAGQTPDEISTEASFAVSTPSVVTAVDGPPALSTPAQRHLIRLPSGALLMAVQRDWTSPPGLHWYRSDDDGLTWRYYKSIFSSTLHLTADAIAVGNDIAIVISYDTTNTGFPSDADDPNRKVYFQWWRFDGAGDWTANALITVDSPASGFAYHRATLARDSTGALWVAAFLRDPCTASPARPARTRSVSG